MVLTTAEVCEFLDISKSTLFRLEKEKKIPIPKRVKQNRLYSSSQIEAILKREYSKYIKGTNPNDFDNLKKIETEKSLYKLITRKYGGSDELKYYEELTAEEIIKALKILIKYYDPLEPIFCTTLEIITTKCKKLR